MSHASSTNPPTLTFLSLFPTTEANTAGMKSPETILLLHTGFSSHRDFTLVTGPLLKQNYHLLVPNIPSHGRRGSSSSLIPFTPQLTVALLADLISTSAPTSRAHIVGVSLGGFMALLLAFTYPRLVNRVFASGCGLDLRVKETFLGRYSLAAMFAFAHPALTMGMAWLPRLAYNALFNAMSLNPVPGLQEDQRAAIRWKIGWAMAESFLKGELGTEMLRRVEAETLLVAAGWGDDVSGTMWMGGELRKGNGESRAAVVKDMGHVWCLQDEKLFGRALLAWVEEGRVLNEMTVL